MVVQIGTEDSTVLKDIVNHKKRSKLLENNKKIDEIYRYCYTLHKSKN
jgi:hypothetical protein